MASGNKKRKGKPGVWAVDESGIDIFGLPIHKPTHRFCAIEKTTDPTTQKTKSKRIYFGTDFKTARLKKLVSARSVPEMVLRLPLWRIL
jgi:hypothetical protein